MKDALLVIDVITDFGHEDGHRLLADFARAQPFIERAITLTRASETPVVYVNDSLGVWDGDRTTLIERARRGAGWELVSSLVPQPGDRFVLKPRYSAFDLTPLEFILSALAVERVLVCGSTTEMCVAQSAIAARERELKVSVLVDACAHVNARHAEIALAYLADVAGVRVVGVESLEDVGLQRSASTPER